MVLNTEMVGRYCKRQAKEYILPGHIFEISRLFASGFRVYLQEAKTNKMHKAKNVLNNTRDQKWQKNHHVAQSFLEIEGHGYRKPRTVLLSPRSLYLEGG